MLIMRSLGSVIKSGFTGIIINLDSIIYKIVGWLYQVFIALSSAKIFTSETFEVFEERFYIILGIAMLFLLAYSLLQSIANPDNFISGNFSMGKIVMNTITSLILIAVMPTIFSVAYHAQEIVMKENIIGKIILGSYSTSSPKLTVTYDDKLACETLGLSGPPCTATYKGSTSNSLELAGNSIAVDVFSAFYYPSLGNSENQSEDSIILFPIEYNDMKNAGVKFTNGAQVLYKDISNYNQCGAEDDPSYVYGEAAENCAMIANAIDDSDYKNRKILYRSILQYAKTTGDFSGFGLVSNLVTEDLMDYSWFISTIAGGFCIYVFLSYCLDMGLRAAKLGFAQLVAPIPILARILPSQANMFNSWVKFTYKTFLDVFIRIAIIFLGIFMVTNLPSLDGLWSSSILTNISVASFKLPLIMDINASYGVLGFARVIVILGILMFMKQAPTLLQQALGIELSTGSLNIRNKLRNMVGGEALMNASSKAAGLVTGGIGAGFLSKRSFIKNPDGTKTRGKFWAAAAQGARAGMRGGGWQYYKQKNNTYQAFTGDDGGVAWFGAGPGIFNKANSYIDRKNIDNQTYYDNLNKKIISSFEKDVLKPIFDKIFKEFDNRKKTYLNNGIIAANNNRALINQRKAQYESSMEYLNILNAERLKAANRIFTENRDKGIKMSNEEVNKKAKEEAQKNMISALKASKSQAARQYLQDLAYKDPNRNDIENKAEQQAINELKKKYPQFNDVSFDFSDQDKAIEKMIEKQKKTMIDNTKQADEYEKAFLKEFNKEFENHKSEYSQYKKSATEISRKGGNKDLENFKLYEEWRKNKDKK